MSILTNKLQSIYSGLSYLLHRANQINATNFYSLPAQITKVVRGTNKLNLLFNKSIESVSADDFGGATSISRSAFYDCSSLTSITIPDSVTTIDDGAFRGCTSLTSLTIPDSVTTIDDGAFRGCTSLTSLTIPDSVTTIGSGIMTNTAYYNDDFNWENGVLYLNNYLVDTKNNISGSVSIKNNIIVIADSAFRNCASLTSIAIPNSVLSIGSYAFGDCINLTNIAIPDSVTRIGNYAFYRCYRFTNIIIPDSVTSIGAYAFQYCTGLTSITLPFVGESLNGTSNTHFGYIFGANFYDYNGRHVPGSLKEVVITTPCKTIGDDAFYDCTSLTNITIPDSVTTIGDKAFYNCTSLTNITIPDSVTSISHSAFRDCTSLTNITIPDSVTSIGYVAFYGCTSLTNIYLNPITPPSLGDTSAIPNITTIHVPVGSGDAYKSATNWSSYADRIVEDIELS